MRASSPVYLHAARGSFDGLEAQTTLLQVHGLEDDELAEGIGDDLNWLVAFPPDDNQTLFWSSWAHEIDTLGT